MLFLNDVCRTCNTQDNTLLNIFAHDENESTPSLMHMLEYCTQTTLSNNIQYPQGICYNCIKQLEICYRFLKRFNLAQNEFDYAQNYVDQKYTDAVVSCNTPTEKLLESCHQKEIVSVSEEGYEKFVSNVEEHENHPEQILESERHDDRLNTNTTKISKPEPATQIASCHICHKSFYTSKALNLHLKINHKQKIIST